ncbi:MAG: hypothetical protein V8T48_11225 [Oscillospiraceae bacterium]
MKKIISLCLSLAMMFSICSIAAQATTVVPGSSISATATGRLIDSDGNEVPVTGYRVDNPATLSAENDECAVTYEYAIPLSTLYHTDSVTGADSTNYLSATLTVYYTEYDMEPAEYLLTKVTGSWSDPNTSDGTSVSDTADIFAICKGIGTENIFRNQTKEGTITSGSIFNTGFQYSILPVYGALGAVMTLNLSQGSTRHWTLELECYPIDPIGGT